MSVLRALGSTWRLCSRNLNQLSQFSSSIFIKSAHRNDRTNNVAGRCNMGAFYGQKRNFSLQSTIESLATTQTGVFRAISESTPVECVQGLLVNLHAATGLPWWATIICTTIMMRSMVTVPLAIYQQYIMAKVENINKEMPEIVKEINKEMSVAVRLYNWNEQTAKYEFKKAVGICYRLFLI